MTGGLVLVLALALTGQAVANESGTGSPGADRPSATDVQWAAMMVVHHRGGIELTQLALEKSDNEGVRDVARQSQRDQLSELPGLLAVALAGGQAPIPPEPPLQRFNDQQMAALQSLSGAEFDRMWLDVFSGHHMGAIMMTDVALAGTAGGLAERLQLKIRDGQLMQVARMNELRAELQAG